MQLISSSFPVPIFRDLREAGAQMAPNSIVIGNFDGVHVGHQALLHEARRHGKKVAVVTFRPHPAAVLQKYEYRPLFPEDHQVRKMAQAGADAVICLEFTEELAHMDALTFAMRLVVDLRMQHVVIGEDFRFGVDRSGDATLLAKFLEAHRVQLHVLPTVSVEGIPVHSRTIREALHRGDLAVVQKMLKEPYTLYGRVLYGFGWGRQLGFPTANLDTVQWLPGDGVYAAIAKTAAGEFYPCAFSVGRRETFGSTLPRSLEAFLIGFSGNLYGQELVIQFHSFVRSQMRFSSKEELIQRMREDVQTVNALLTGEVLYGFR